jgi:malonate-semialdehyde dehydrogenase (acetylating) / methylmalonate-semialdehyde dehydrogenase
MTTAIKKPETCRLLIDGSWYDSPARETLPVHNPSTGKVIARVPLSNGEDVDRAIAAAHKAFADWREMPVVERARYMFRFRSLLEKNADEIARVVSREHGKTFAEAKASVNRGIEVVEFACSIPSLIAGETVENLASGVDCETNRHPLGVCVGITPFNFPAMLPLWMFPVALTCGNTFVLKPSEKVPLTSIMIAEFLMESGIPAGVLNIVHGGKECVDALISHPLVKAISFVGSTPVAKHVYTLGTSNGKRVQANGGAKNHVIVMPDADPNQTVEALRAAAFGCAGERCMAGSLAIPVGDAANWLVPELVNSASRMKVGPTDRAENPDMGPLISPEHLSRVKSLIDKGEAEGATLALDGRRLKPPANVPNGFYLGPTILDHAQPGMTVVKEEIFGPVLTVVHVRNVEEAIKLGTSCDYGNGAVIFTQSGDAARQFKRHFNAGLIGINVGVPAPMAWFPFTGWNQSFFGDLHMQGKESILFYTQQKITMTRWFHSRTKEFDDPVWRSKS